MAGGGACGGNGRTVLALSGRSQGSFFFLVIVVIRMIEWLNGWYLFLFVSFHFQLKSIELKNKKVKRVVRFYP